MRALPAFAFGIAAAAAACNPYDPDLGDRPFKCGTSDPRCPDGYACEGTGASAVCVKNGAGDAGIKADASHVQCGTDSSLEPNDDLQHATNTPVRDQETDYSLAMLAICPSTDIDIYHFDTTSVGQQTVITLTYDPTQGELEMQLLTAQGSPAGFEGQPAGDTLVISTNRLSVDQWYLQVQAAAPNVENNYSLDINVTP